MEITGLSFSGGALKGIAYCGVLKWLEKKKIIPQVNHISGTSIGALFGLLIVLGYTYKEVRDIIYDLDAVNQLEDIDITTFFINYGLATGEKIESFIKNFITRKGYNESITFKELYEFTSKRMSFMTCRVNDSTEFVFDHLSSPDFQVYKACKISMSIPILWKSNKVDESYYIDGCFIRNLPIHIHENKANTLGFYLVTPFVDVQTNNFEDYVYQIHSCISRKGQNLELENCDAKGYTVIKIYGSVNVTLTPTKTQKREIIDNGYKACENFRFNLIL